MAITQSELMSILEYSPETGIFTWLNHRFSRRNGNRAGGLDDQGYERICIDSKSYRSHRLAWLYVHGHLPEQIDHINRIKDDNRMANLRLCNHSQNAANRLPKNRKLPTGVQLTPSGKYQASICHKYKYIYLGLHDTPELASEAYQYKKTELFSKFS